MVSSEFETLVFDVVDANQDFTIKLIIFGCIIFYAFLLYYMTNRMNVQSFAQSIFFLFSKIYIYITAFFLPLFTIMLFREYEAVSLWTLLLQMYSVIFVIAFFGLLLFGWQKVLDMVGIDYKIGIMEREQKRRGEE